MTRYLTPLLALVIIVAPSCKPTRIAPSALTGKLVIAGLCGQQVIQVIQGSVPSGKIDSAWKDPETDTVYNNVFTVSNHCQFGETATGVGLGDIFTFELTDRPKANECFVCFAARAVPNANNAVVNIRKIK